jgi:DNA-binding PadR family transcriptional regulator
VNTREYSRTEHNRFSRVVLCVADIDRPPARLYKSNRRGRFRCSAGAARAAGIADQANWRQVVLDYAILGLLRRGPDYGYRLKSRMERLGASSWDINTGHIYYALKQLGSGGFVQRVDDPSTDTRDADHGQTPDAHYYEITDAGADRLRCWLDGPPRTPRTTRFEIVVRWMTLGDDRIEDALEQLHKESRIHQRYVSRLLRGRSASASSDEPYGVLAELAEQHAITQARAHTAWIENSMECLRERLGARSRALSGS